MNAFMELNKHKKPVNAMLWLLSLLPFLYVIYCYFVVSLANPFEFLIVHSGRWAMIFFLASYGVSPFCRLITVVAAKQRWARGKRLADWNFVIFQRRMLGLNSFYYAGLHFFVYFNFEIDFSFEEWYSEISERYFVLVGSVALLLLVVLAATSLDNIQRLLKKKWKTVHKLIYPTAVLLIMHIVMVEKNLTLDLILFTLTYVLLSVERLLHFFQYIVDKRQNFLLRLARRTESSPRINLD
jgi:sulfoxide reductase heme-binding subunit YedZ